MAAGNAGKKAGAVSTILASGKGLLGIAAGAIGLDYFTSGGFGSFLRNTGNRAMSGYSDIQAIDANLDNINLGEAAWSKFYGLLNGLFAAIGFQAGMDWVKTQNEAINDRIKARTDAISDKTNVNISDIAETLIPNALDGGPDQGITPLGVAATGVAATGAAAYGINKMRSGNSSSGRSTGSAPDGRSVMQDAQTGRDNPSINRSNQDSSERNKPRRGNRKLRAVTTIMGGAVAGGIVLTNSDEASASTPENQSQAQAPTLPETFEAVATLTPYTRVPMAVAGMTEDVINGETEHLVEDGVALAGGAAVGLAGAQAGMAIGALGGPFAWATVPAGGFIGGVAGFIAGEWGARQMTDAFNDSASQPNTAPSHVIARGPTFG